MKLKLLKLVNFKILNNKIVNAIQFIVDYSLY